MQRQSNARKYSTSELLLFKELQIPKYSIRQGVEIADTALRILRRLIDLERRVRMLERKGIKPVKLTKPLGGER